MEPLSKGHDAERGGGEGQTVRSSEPTRFLQTVNQNLHIEPAVPGHKGIQISQSCFGGSLSHIASPSDTALLPHCIHRCQGCLQEPCLAKLEHYELQEAFGGSVAGDIAPQNLTASPSAVFLHAQHFIVGMS